MEAGSQYGHFLEPHHFYIIWYVMPGPLDKVFSIVSWVFYVALISVPDIRLQLSVKFESHQLLLGRQLWLVIDTIPTGSRRIGTVRWFPILSRNRRFSVRMRSKSAHNTRNSLYLSCSTSFSIFGTCLVLVNEPRLRKSSSCGWGRWTFRCRSAVDSLSDISDERR